MKWKKLYSTEHLDASDLPDGGALVQIESVKATLVEGENGKESKALIRFKPGRDLVAAFAQAKQTPKTSWIAAKTCGYCLCAMFGDDTEQWVGKLVLLHSERVFAFGDWTDGIRVAGSPYINEPITIRVKAGKKKQQITLHPCPGPGQSNGGQRPPPSNSHPTGYPGDAPPRSKAPRDADEPGNDVNLPPMLDGEE